MSRRITATRSPIHGRGVFAVVDLPKGIELIEYRGRRITHAQANRYFDGGADTGHTFLFTLDDRWLIDASVGGNSARWINHSCAPNCRAVIEVDTDAPRRSKVVIETIRPVRAGEEITYDYGIVLEEPHTARMKKIWACRCGARHCTGTMLRDKRRKPQLLVD